MKDKIKALLAQLTPLEVVETLAELWRENEQHGIVAITERGSDYFDYGGYGSAHLVAEMLFFSANEAHQECARRFESKNLLGMAVLKTVTDIVGEFDRDEELKPHKKDARRGCKSQNISSFELIVSRGTRH